MLAGPGGRTLPGVTEPANWLLTSRLRALRETIVGAADPDAAAAAWAAAERAVGEAGAGEDAVVALPVLERSLPDLDALLAAWAARRTPLPAWDQAVLHRAMNAFKKRLSLTRADDEVSSSRNPLSRGATSGITGIPPPERFPRDVWDLLVAQGRLRDAGHGLLEPAGGRGT
jgi:hypothetical protein